MYGINQDNKCSHNVTSTPLVQNACGSLHGACIRGDLDLLKHLINNGTSLTETDDIGYTALQLASAHGHVEIVKELLKFKVTDVNAQDHVHGNTSAHEAAWNGFSRTLTELIKSGANVNIVNQNNFSPLHLAAQNGHNESARILLYAGCDPDLQNGYGDTAMHTSSRYGHAGVTRILISARSNVNVQNLNGDTPLHISVALKQKKITNLLIGAGVNISALNCQRENALDIARRKNYEELVNMLTESLRIVHLNNLKTKQQQQQQQHLPPMLSTTKNQTSTESKETKSKPKSKWLWFMKKSNKQKSQRQQPALATTTTTSTATTRLVDDNNLNTSQSLPTSPEKRKTDAYVNPENVLQNFQRHQVTLQQQQQQQQHQQHQHFYNMVGSSHNVAKNVDNKQKEHNPLFASYNLLSQPTPQDRYACPPGMQYYRDLAGNIKQGPIGCVPPHQQLNNNNNLNNLNNNMVPHSSSKLLINPQQQQLGFPGYEYTPWNFPNPDEHHQQQYLMGFPAARNNPTVYGQQFSKTPSLYSQHQSHQHQYNYPSSNVGNYFTTSSQLHTQPYFNPNPLLAHQNLGLPSSRQPSISGASRKSKGFNTGAVEPAIFRSKSDDTLSTVTSKPCHKVKNNNKESKEQLHRHDNHGKSVNNSRFNNDDNFNNNLGDCNTFKNQKKNSSKDNKSKMRNNELLAASSGSSSSSLARERTNRTNMSNINCSKIGISERNVTDDSNPDSGFGDEHNKCKPPLPQQQQQYCDPTNNSNERRNNNNNNNNKFRNKPPSNHNLNYNNNDNNINNNNNKNNFEQGQRVNSNNTLTSNNCNSNNNNNNNNNRNKNLTSSTNSVNNNNNNNNRADDLRNVNNNNNNNNEKNITNNTGTNNNNNNLINNINKNNSNLNVNGSVSNQSTDDNSSSIISDSESVMSLSCRSL